MVELIKKKFAKGEEIETFQGGGTEGFKFNL